MGIVFVNDLPKTTILTYDLELNSATSIALDSFAQSGPLAEPQPGSGSTEARGLRAEPAAPAAPSSDPTQTVFFLNFNVIDRSLRLDRVLALREVLQLLGLLLRLHRLLSLGERVADRAGLLLPQVERDVVLRSGGGRGGERRGAGGGGVGAGGGRGGGGKASRPWRQGRGGGRGRPRPRGVEGIAHLVLVENPELLLLRLVDHRQHARDGLADHLTAGAGSAWGA